MPDTWPRRNRRVPVVMSVWILLLVISCCWTASSTADTYVSTADVAASTADVAASTADIAASTADVAASTTDVVGSTADDIPSASAASRDRGGRRTSPQDQLSAEGLKRAARDFGADSRFLFGFPTGSALTLTITLLTPIIDEGPVNGKLNLTWVPVAIPIDRPTQQLEYVRGTRSRSDDFKDMFASMQAAIDGFGYPGDRCVFRTLCEAAGRRGDGEFMTRVTQLILDASDDGGLADDDDFSSRTDEVTELTQARRRGQRDVGSCSAAYSDCPGSIFDLMDAISFI